MDFVLYALPISLVLALVALAGYAAGRNWSVGLALPEQAVRRERKQAETVARELETIAQEVRRQLATHHASVERFRERLSQWRSENEGDATCEGLFADTEDMLDPTVRLAEGMVRAYEQLRRQSTKLNTFQEVRRDAVTGLPNRATLNHTLESLLDMGERFGTHFCLLLVDVAVRPGERVPEVIPSFNERLRRAGKIARSLVRRTDLVARFGAEELAIVLPQAEFIGAQGMAMRLSEAWQAECGEPLPAGIARSVGGDTFREVIKRADAALYCARSGGEQTIYLHDGERLAARLDDATGIDAPTTPTQRIDSAADAEQTRDEAERLQWELAELLA